MIGYQKCDLNATEPMRQTEGAAGYDLCACESVLLMPGSIRMVDTGIVIEIPPNWYGKIESRSSLALRGLVTLGGVIDSDYRGTVRCILHNVSGESFEVRVGFRIAQIIFQSFEAPQFLETEKLSETDRGLGGFGSTN